MYSRGVIAIRLNTDIENRLKALAKKTGLTKTFYVREAILNHLEALEDIRGYVCGHATCIASRQNLYNRGSKTCTGYISLVNK